MTIKNITKVDSVAIELAKDPQTFTDVIATRISDEMERDILDKVKDELLLDLFGPIPEDEVKAFIQVLITDPEIKEKMVAYRTKQRMGIS